LSAFVLEAELALRQGVNPAAVGARLDAIAYERRFALVRNEQCSESSWIPLNLDRAAALRGDSGWRLINVRSRAVAEGERDPAERLLSGPRRSF
jgi:hypothetical protein